jgi:hypothetical protein
VRLKKNDAIMGPIVKIRNPRIAGIAIPIPHRRSRRACPDILDFDGRAAGTSTGFRPVVTDMRSPHSCVGLGFQRHLRG